MVERTAFVIPHELNFCPRLGRTPPCPREGVLQTIWQAKARAVGAMHLGEVGKEVRLAPCLAGVYFCQSGADHFSQKGQRAFVPTLLNRFWRPLNLRSHLRHFRGQLRKRGLGITPHPAGDQGQKEFARNVRGALDKAGPTGGSFDVVGGKALC